MLGLGNSIGEYKMWDPSDLTSSVLKIWYKNGAGITSDGGTPDLVSQWDDSSGNAKHAAQGTRGNQADLVGGGLDFELTQDDHYDIATGTGALSFGHPNAFTASFVVKREDDGNNTLFSDSSTEFLGFYSGNDGIRFRTKGDNGETSTLNFGTANLWATGTTFILTITKDTSGVILVYKNGVLAAYEGGEDSSNTGVQCDVVTFGTKDTDSPGQNFDGIIYEVIVCNAILNTSDLSNLHSYLTHKFGI